MTNYEMVMQFHKTFGSAIGEYPKIDFSNVEMRKKLIEEEYQELLDGIANDDIVEVADALTDILYVVYGCAITFGIDIDECFREVHRSNMTKLDENGNVLYREDGKILKGPNYERPNLKTLIEKQIEQRKSLQPTEN